MHTIFKLGTLSVTYRIFLHGSQFQFCFMLCYVYASKIICQWNIKWWKKKHFIAPNSITNFLIHIISPEFRKKIKKINLIQSMKLEADESEGKRFLIPVILTPFFVLFITFWGNYVHYSPVISNPDLELIFLKSHYSGLYWAVQVTNF